MWTSVSEKCETDVNICFDNFYVGVGRLKLGDGVFVLVEEDGAPMVVECSPKERLVGKTEDEEVGRDVKSSVKKRRKKKKRERWWKEKSVVALVGRGVCHKEVATERPAQTVPKYAVDGSERFNVSKKQGIHQQGKGNYSYSYDSRSKALGVCNKTLQKEREEYEEGEKRRSTSVSYFPETDVDIRNVQEFKLEVSIMLMALSISSKGRTPATQPWKPCFHLMLCEWLQLINLDVEIKMVENTLDDPRQRKPDITKAKELLGWEPKVKLKDGLPLMEENFCLRLGVDKMDLWIKLFKR
ncbi:dTDP-glucose 4 [Vigna unguiculata]|uniref:dTDP-glucose 4 n=1 Tax=Vigna unguiculata TaxID=3917 RepID=A0A4D6NDE3_VIGUN|nr:dTDP-glucose 4 [Vigna unguiculata]